MHTLVRELLELLPPDGAPWPRPARRRWVRAVGAVLDVLYEDDPLPRPRADTDSGAFLDLRSNQTGEGSVRGRHAAPPRSTD